MRSRILAWTLAAMVAVAMVAAVVIAQAGDPDEAAMNSLPRATATTVSVQPSPERAPTSPSNPVPVTTGSAAPTPPTTAPVSTTTAPPSSEESGYTSVPKPGAGAGRVAPGGAFTKHLTADIATAFGFSPAEVEMALTAVQMPPEAGGNPEGWLAPGQYEPADGASAREVVQAMVDRRVQDLESRGIPREQWYRVLTAASVIEKETYNRNEKPKVARVLTNRLADGVPLQMDSIILYPVSEDRIFTTQTDRQSDQPYNSYRHEGLPPTPICSPDEVSIDAFLAPPPGDWWFYVTVDLNSGEIRYSVTYEEHLTNVELLRAWLRENPTE